MKFPFFASFIVFCLWLKYQLKKSSKQAGFQSQSFWEREAEANNTRRKSLENLDYITIPKKFFSVNPASKEDSSMKAVSSMEATSSMEAAPSMEMRIYSALHKNSRAMECLEILKELSTQKIVNFTGLSNTDLKLSYGAANIKLLMEFDQNYTLLARTLQSLAEEMYKAGLLAECRELLEFAVSTRTDVSQSYFLLADLYDHDCQPEKIEGLIQTAEGLNTVMKNSIVRTLQESGPYSGLLRSL